MQYNASTASKVRTLFSLAIAFSLIVLGFLYRNLMQDVHELNLKYNDEDAIAPLFQFEKQRAIAATKKQKAPMNKQPRTDEMSERDLNNQKSEMVAAKEDSKHVIVIAQIQHTPINPKGTENTLQQRVERQEQNETSENVTQGLVIESNVIAGQVLKVAQVQHTPINPKETEKTLQQRVERQEQNETSENVTQGTVIESNATMEKAFPRFFNREPKPRPPLDSIVQGWDIIGDSSWILNFAIAGFPKCGTSTLMYHLETHPEIKVFDYERCEMSGRQYVPLMRDLYNKLPEGDYIRGIKCPRDMENPQNAIPGYSQVFPKSKLIAGIRHPVLWFESFYNFRVNNGQEMPAAEKMKKACGGGYNGVCTDRGQFHFQLANLGKTKLLPEEDLLMEKRRTRRRTVANFTQPVFLYEVSQLSDIDEARSLELRRGLTNFLELKEEIKPFIWYRPGKSYDDNQKKLEEVNALKIDICDSKYDSIRSYIMENSVNASKWISEYFLDAPGVYVSSRDHFVNTVMKSWQADPCVERRKKLQEAKNNITVTDPASQG